MRSLSEITDDENLMEWTKAKECLRALDHLPHNDIARPDYRCAAVVFAIFGLQDIIDEVGAELVRARSEG